MSEKNIILWQKLFGKSVGNRSLLDQIVIGIMLIMGVQNVLQD